MFQLKQLFGGIYSPGREQKLEESRGKTGNLRPAAESERNWARKWTTLGLLGPP